MMILTAEWNKVETAALQTGVANNVNVNEHYQPQDPGAPK